MVRLTKIYSAKCYYWHRSGLLHSFVQLHGQDVFRVNIGRTSRYSTAHIKVYSPPSVANNMFSAPLPLRTRICRHIYHPGVSPWGVFHKVRVLIKPLPIWEYTVQELLTQFFHSVFYLCFWSWKALRSHTQKKNRTGELEKFERKFPFSLHDFFSDYDAMVELSYLKIFSQSAWFLNVFSPAVPWSVLKKQKGFPVCREMGTDTIHT